MGTAIVVYDGNQEQVPRSRMGRPSKYDEWIATLICNKIAEGVTRNAAAEAAGITRETLFDWLRDNEDFSYRVARADAEAEILFTDCLRRGAVGEPGYKGDPKMSVEWLKRRRRADYGDTLDIRKVDAAQLLAMLQAQAGASTGDDVQAISDGFEDI